MASPPRKYQVSLTYQRNGIAQVNAFTNEWGAKGYHLHTIELYEDGTWLIVMELENAYEYQRGVRTSDVDQDARAGG